MAISLIFPAFGEKIADKDLKFYDFYKNIFDEYSYLHSPHTAGEILHDELKAQEFAYTYSIIASRIIKPKVNVSYYAGYSMGIYAAICSAGSIDENTGLSLIRKAYELITGLTGNADFAMATILGLEEKDITTLLKPHKNSTIINTTNKYSFVISGTEDEIDKIVAGAIEEGAGNSRKLFAKSPYHTPHIKEAEDIFIDYIKSSVQIKNPDHPIISTVDRRIITDKDDVINELGLNLVRSINWQKTFEKLLENGTDKFVECGPGKSLTKIAKFIDGNYEILSIDKFI